MAVAYIQFHWKLAFDQNFFPTINHGELAVLDCFIFLFIASRGAGKWALQKQS
jgi:putative oxidoreductase